MTDIAATGEEVEAIQSAPALFPDLAEIFETYIIVSRCRPQSMGDAPPSITLMDVEAAYRLFGFEDWLTPREFVNYMFTMDKVTLDYYREHHSKET